MASEWSEAELKRAVIAVSELQGPASTSRYEVALALACQRNCLRDALKHLLKLNNLRDRTDPDCCKSCQFVVEARAALAKCPKEGRDGR